MALNLGRLKELVAQGEGEHIEFKNKAADPVKIMKEVVAFANKSGGYLIVGVTDDGGIKGVKDAMEEMFVLEQTIASYCKPVVNYDAFTVNINAHKQVVVFKIHENERKPVFLLYNKNKKIGKAYIRVEDRSVQMSPELRSIMKARWRGDEGLFSFGEKERKLMQFMENNPKTTVEEFSKSENIPLKEAAMLFVQLTISNVLEVIPGEMSDYFMLVEKDDEV
ncbi:AlbA family DNA-binding domain-containing protein [Sediminitomix flava]|uniref:Putative DNA-binding protein n=1 Tax=Sediminitomix flava TaxID=379075 RepID=A0A315ZBB8_SEDFL|nr:ATP-binding protein [Sediminitomix flava]PWJ42592.1 putative DNA-binding protein [Sediminitomix flava]